MIVAVVSMLALLSGVALMAGAVVARREDRYHIADRHHLGVLRVMPYDWEREPDAAYRTGRVTS